MMTEAELWHMHLLAVENTSAGLEGVSTIIFGYLAATYLIGAKLSRFQAANNSLCCRSINQNYILVTKLQNKTLQLHEHTINNSSDSHIK